MKRIALCIALLSLLVSAAYAVSPEDKDLSAGLRQYNRRNFKSAAKLFRTALDRQPDPASYYLLGYSLYKLRKFRESEEAFNQAFLIDPGFTLGKAGLLKNPSGKEAK